MLRQPLSASLARAGGGGTLVRILIVVMVSLGFLALVLWAAVWLAIRLL